MGQVGYYWEHTEVTKLAADLSGVPRNTCRELNQVVTRHTKTLTEMWKANAKISAGKTGKLYPRTIRGTVASKSRGACWAVGEIQPRENMPQGGMAFEYGGPTRARVSVGGPIPVGNGRNSKGPGIGQRVGQDEPHLDMNRAADIVFPLFQRDMRAVADIRL